MRNDHADGDLNWTLDYSKRKAIDPVPVWVGLYERDPFYRRGFLLWWAAIIGMSATSLFTECLIRLALYVNKADTVVFKILQNIIT